MTSSPTVIGDDRVLQQRYIQRLEVSQSTSQIQYMLANMIQFLLSQQFPSPRVGFALLNFIFWLILITRTVNMMVAFLTN